MYARVLLEIVPWFSTMISPCFLVPPNYIFPSFHCKISLVRLKPLEDLLGISGFVNSTNKTNETKVESTLTNFYMTKVLLASV